MTKEKTITHQEYVEALDTIENYESQEAERAGKNCKYKVEQRIK